MHTVALFGEILADVFPDETILGGAPYNVARHLRALQQRPILISKTGQDVLKATLFAELAKLDIHNAGIQIDAAYPTGQVTVHIENKQHRFTINPDQAYDHIDAQLARQTVEATQPDLVYFGTLAQRHKDSKQALDAFLNASHCPRFLDINLRAPWYNKSIMQDALSQADIVKINDEELAITCDFFAPHLHHDKERALFLVNTFSLKNIFITCGAHGAWTLSDSGKETRVETQALTSPLVDTVGAGDAFTAICIIGLLRNWPMQVLLTRANTFASAICTTRGAAPNRDDFYSPYLKDWL